MVYGVLDDYADLPKEMTDFQVYQPSVAELYKIPPANVSEPDQTKLGYIDIPLDHTAQKSRFCSLLAKQMNQRFK